VSETSFLRHECPTDV